MRLFNRILVTLLLVAWLIIGIFGVLYAFRWLGYSIYDFPGQVRASSFYRGTVAWVRSIDAGTPGPWTVIICVALIILGLLLLYLELWPRRPDRVRLGEGTWATRRLVAAEAVSAASEQPDVLVASARVKPLRRGGAKLGVSVSARRGTDLAALRQGVQEGVRDRMEAVGIPISGLKVRTTQVDPRRAEVRVR